MYNIKLLIYICYEITVCHTVFTCSGLWYLKKKLCTLYHHHECEGTTHQPYKVEEASNWDLDDLSRR